MQKAQKARELTDCKSVKCVAEVTHKWNVIDSKQSKAFNDAYDSCRNYAKCDQFYKIHVVERERLTRMGIEQFKKDLSNGRLNENWKAVPDNKNAFHNFTETGNKVREKVNGKYPNIKYIHNNGNFEVIISRERSSDGKVAYIEQPNSRATYNYGTTNLDHIDFDVDPWADFGSGYGDNTTYGSRRVRISGKYFGEFSMFEITKRRNAISEFEKIDRQQTRD